MSSIPDQLKNILNNEFGTVNAGLKLGSNLAKQIKDFYENGIISIEDEERSGNVMRKENIYDVRDYILSIYRAIPDFAKEKDKFLYKKTNKIRDSSCSNLWSNALTV